ncbi:hypothetical protein RJ639_010510 [Escallonia herrerae]|uniref:Uncharacterized protein n=1 Tax=Escallonia herrerae TaxID=1293975 RepID=A0AA88VPH9_9ASTE|nr:hypothetical protein RJ639_010510 [Escallonia herrerae]
MTMLGVQNNLTVDPDVLVQILNFFLLTMYFAAYAEKMQESSGPLSLLYRCQYLEHCTASCLPTHLLLTFDYGIIVGAASAGLGLLQFCNLNSYRTKFILGFSLFMGLSVPQYFNEYVITTGVGPVHTRFTWFNKIMLVIFTSPATVAAIIALFLDCTLARKHSLTRRDSGRHWWGKFDYFDKDPRSAEFYVLPLGLSKYFPSV